MHLTNVDLADFKGLDVSHALKPLTLLTGPNGSGKSAVLEAIQFVIEGITPLGRTLEATEGMVGPSGGWAAVDVGDHRIARSVAIDHRAHTTSMGIVIDGQNIPKKAAESRIAELLGRNGELFAPMFRLGDFLDLSDDKRRDFVLNLCSRAAAGGGAVGSDTAALLHDIELGFLSIALGEGTAKVAGGEMSTLRRQLNEKQQAALNSVMLDLGRTMAMETDPAMQINKAIEHAKDRANAAKRLKDEGFAAARSLAERRAGLTVVAESVEGMEARLAKLREEATVLREQVARREGSDAARNQLRNRLAALHDELDHMPVAPPTVDLGEADALEAQAKELRVALPPPVDTGDAEAALAEAEVALVAARDREGHLFRAVSMKLTAKERTQRDLDALESNDWVKLVDLLNSFYRALPTIPEGEATDRWIYVVEFVNYRCGPTDRERLIAAAELTSEEYATANELYQGASLAHNEASIAYRAAEERLASLRIRDAELRRESAAAALKADELMGRALKIRAAAMQAQVDLDSRAAKIADLQSRIVQTEAELNRLDSEAGGFVSLESLTAQQTAITAQGKEVAAYLDTKRRFVALTDELAQAQAAAERQAVEWEVSKSVAESARQVREQFMVKLIEPLIGNIDMFLSAAGVAWKAYCRLVDEGGKRIFDIGIEREGTRITHPALSGGERVLFGAALAYALVQLADPPLKLLMLEAAEANTDTLECILIGCEALQANLSNVIVATHLSVEEGNWHIIELALPEVVA